jgi:hypothetical protein
VVRKGNSKYLFWITVISIVISSIPAFSQQGNLYVKPMIIEVAPFPGMTVVTDFEVRNASERAQRVDFELHKLTQTKNASLQILPPDSNTGVSDAYSCRDWITLSKPSTIVAPSQATTIKVKIKVPPRAKGFYLAGLTATLKPTEAPGAVGIAVRFLVPILVQIRAQALRENKVEGSILLKKRVGKNWRRITEAAFDKRKIIPGAEVKLETDIERRLPSGRYMLFGQLYVGGRRAKPLEKEIDFAGDPTITQTATDAAIEVEPEHISVETGPGATRTKAMRVSNASNAEVNITMEAAIPPTLKSVALGELRGEELACPQWIKVTPDNFKLRPNGRQNIRITAAMPDSELPHANYYASLNLRASYGDSQNAGKKSALICVHNRNLESKPQSHVMGLTITAEKASRYIIRATFGNVGNVHFSPKCRATITNEEGKIKAKLPLKGDSSSMFPLELRDFFEVVDFSGFEAGRYYVEVFGDYGTDQIARGTMPIRVSVEGMQRIVEIIEPEKKAAQ